MKKVKLLTLLMIVNSLYLYSQEIKNYETKYVIETSSSYEKQGADDGQLDTTYEEKIAIIHNTKNNTIRVFNPISNETHWLFENVIFDKYYKSNIHQTLETYKGTCAGYNYFISFSDKYIKIDNRELFKHYTLVF